MGEAVCIIPNCGRDAAASEPFCSYHRHERRPFAYCCAEGGGDPEYCDCVNKNHGTALHALAARKEVG